MFGEPIFQVAPEAFNWIKFWRVSWQEQQNHVSWEMQALRGMECSVVEHEDVQAVSVLRGEMVKEELASLFGC